MYQKNKTKNTAKPRPNRVFMILNLKTQEPYTLNPKSEWDRMTMLLTINDHENALRLGLTDVIFCYLLCIYLSGQTFIFYVIF